MSALDHKRERLLRLFDNHCRRVEASPGRDDLRCMNGHIRERIALCDSAEALRGVSATVGELVAGAAQYLGVRG